MILLHSKPTAFFLLCAALTTAALTPSCGSVSESSKPRIKSQSVSEKLSFALPSELTTRSAAVAATQQFLIEDRATVRTEDGEGFSAVASGGSDETHVGMDAQVGNIWSAARVFLQGRNDPNIYNVRGDVNTGSSLQTQNDAAVWSAANEATPIETNPTTIEFEFPAGGSGDENLLNGADARHESG